MLFRDQRHRILADLLSQGYTAAIVTLWLHHGQAYVHCEHTMIDLALPCDGGQRQGRLL